MTVIYILLPISIILAIAGLCAYLWSVNSGQFDDLDTPPLRMLLDEEEKSESNTDKD